MYARVCIHATETLVGESDQARQPLLACQTSPVLGVARFYLPAFFQPEGPPGTASGSSSNVRVYTSTRVYRRAATKIRHTRKK